MFNDFFRISFHLWDNVYKYGGARDAADDNKAHARCVLDKQGYTRASTCQRPWPHARTHLRTQTQNFVILIAFPRQKCFRKRASVLHYTYIFCCVVPRHMLLVWSNDGGWDVQSTSHAWEVDEMIVRGSFKWVNLDPWKPELRWENNMKLNPK
jgi:hypothetical protein